MFYEYKMIVIWTNGNKWETLYDLKSIAERDKQNYLEMYGNDIKRIIIKKL